MRNAVLGLARSNGGHWAGTLEALATAIGAPDPGLLHVELIAMKQDGLIKLHVDSKYGVAGIADLDIRLA